MVIFFLKKVNTFKLKKTGDIVKIELGAHIDGMLLFWCFFFLTKN